MLTTKNLPSGVWPVMITPFKADKTIDWRGVDQVVDWYLQNGCDGLFTVCGSGEMFELDNEERVEMARYVVRRVNHRIPVIATATFVYSVTEQADFIKKIYDIGVDAVICLANHFARENEGEKQWQEWALQIVEKTENIPLGIYECPLPYKRLVSPLSLELIKNSGRFLWLKETSEDIGLLKRKLNIVKGSSLKIFNAYAASLLESLQNGAAGYCGIATNFYPELFRWLCLNYEKDVQTAQELQNFISEAQGVVDHKYLSSAKQFLRLSGLNISTVTRIPEIHFSPVEVEKLKSLRIDISEWHERLKLKSS